MLMFVGIFFLKSNHETREKMISNNRRSRSPQRGGGGYDRNDRGGDRYGGAPRLDRGPNTYTMWVTLLDYILNLRRRVFSRVFFFFNAGGSVCVWECVYTHTHTHTTEVLGCESRSRDETPGRPEESRWTKSWRTYIRICVQSTHVCIHVKRRDEILD